MKGVRILKKKDSTFVCVFECMLHTNTETNAVCLSCMIEQACYANSKEHAKETKHILGLQLLKGLPCC
jgi:hypothetical protein